MTTKKKVILLAIIGFILSVGLNVYLFHRSSSLKKDYQRQLNNVTALTTESRTDTIRESIPVTTQGVVSETVRELNQQHIIDQQLIKDLNIKIKDLTNVGTISAITTDTVYLIKTDSTDYHYADAWANIQVKIPSGRCIYNTRDSLQTYIYEKYRHKFLWWRWGKEGYEVKIVNYNPHSRISYSQFVNIEK